LIIKLSLNNDLFENRRAFLKYTPPPDKMQESLEGIIDAEQKSTVDTQPTLKQQLADSIRNYPATWKEYMINMTPATIATMAGAALGKWSAAKLGYTGDLAQTLALYAGYPFGYGTFFTLAYLRNKEKYQGILSKEFGKFVGTFLAADYVADLLVFSPIAITSAIYLNRHSDLNPAAQGAIVIGVAGVCYTSTMAALHPVMQRITTRVNETIKSAYHTVTGATHSKDISA